MRHRRRGAAGKFFREKVKHGLRMARAEVLVRIRIVDEKVQNFQARRPCFLYDKHFKIDS